MIKQQAMRNIVNSCHPQSHRDSVKKFSKNSRRFTTLFKRSMRCLMSLATTAVTVASTMLKLSMSSDDLDWEYTISPSPRIHYCYRWPYQDLFVLRSGHIDPLMLFISVTAGTRADSRPSHTDVNVISIIVLMAPSITATCRCGDDGNSLNTSNTSWAHQNAAETPSKVSNAWVCMLGLKQGGNFRGSFYLTEIKQVHSIVDNLVYNLFLFRMIGTETDVAVAQ